MKIKKEGDEFILHCVEVWAGDTGACHMDKTDWQSTPDDGKEERNLENILKLLEAKCKPGTAQ